MLDERFSASTVANIAYQRFRIADVVLKRFGLTAEDIKGIIRDCRNRRYADLTKHAAQTIRKQPRELQRQMLFEIDDICVRTVWEEKRNVYEISTDLWRLAGNMTATAELAAEALSNIPHSTPFIGFPHPIVFEAEDEVQEVHGVFVLGHRTYQGQRPEGGVGTSEYYVPTDHPDSEFLSFIFVGLLYDVEGNPVKVPEYGQDMILTRSGLNVERGEVLSIHELIDRSLKRFKLPLSRGEYSGDPNEELKRLIHYTVALLSLLGDCNFTPKDDKRFNVWEVTEKNAAELYPSSDLATYGGTGKLSARNAPVIRDLLYQWYVRHGARSYDEQMAYTLREVNAATDHDYTYKIELPVHSYSQDWKIEGNPKLIPRIAGRVARRDTSAVRNSELFWVSSDMTRLSVSEGTGLTDYDLHPEVLPSDTGLVIWNDPIEYVRAIPGSWAHQEDIAENITAHPGEDLYGAEQVHPIQVAVWSRAFDPIGRPGVLVSFYTTEPDRSWRDQAKLLSHHNQDYFRERACKAGLAFYKQIVMPLYQDGTFGHPSLDRMEDPRRTSVLITESLMRTMMATWLLMDQEIVTVARTQPDRNTRRSLARGPLPASPITVVTLRRKQYRIMSEEESAEYAGLSDAKKRTYSCRWIVHPHGRDQWYPSLGTHKRIRIKSYVKGPEGAPLLIKPRVKKLVR